MVVAPLLNDAEIFIKHVELKPIVKKRRRTETPRRKIHLDDRNFSLASQQSSGLKVREPLQGIIGATMLFQSKKVQCWHGSGAS